LEQSAKNASNLTDPLRSAAVLDDLFARAAIKSNRELAAVVMNSV
jgi:hypothetical protein